MLPLLEFLIGFLKSLILRVICPLEQTSTQKQKTNKQARLRPKVTKCSSDISELRIRILYERILRIHVCQYAHLNAYIWALYVSVMHISLVGQTKDIYFYGIEEAFKAKFAYC